jgi:hypothetical protein
LIHSRDKQELGHVRDRAEYIEQMADRTAATFKLSPHNAQHQADPVKQAHAQAQHTGGTAAHDQQHRRRQDGSDQSDRKAPVKSHKPAVSPGHFQSMTSVEDDAGREKRLRSRDGYAGTDLPPTWTPTRAFTPEFIPCKMRYLSER